MRDGSSQMRSWMGFCEDLQVIRMYMNRFPCYSMLAPYTHFLFFLTDSLSRDARNRLENNSNLALYLTMFCVVTL